MKKFRLLLIAVAMTLAGAAHAASPSQPRVEYSADSVIETPEISMRGHISYTLTPPV